MKFGNRDGERCDCTHDGGEIIPLLASTNPATPNTPANTAMTGSNRAIRGSTSRAANFRREPTRAASARAAPRIAPAPQGAPTPQARPKNGGESVATNCESQ